MKYSKGHKYLLEEDYFSQTRIFPNKPIETDKFILDPRGWLHMFKGYAWDGSSGPTWDSKWCMSASLEHDNFAEALRKGQLPQRYLQEVDLQYKERMIKAGMPLPVAWLRHQVLEELDFYADPKNKREIIEVP